MNPIEVADKIVDESLYKQIADKTNWEVRKKAAYLVARHYLQPEPTEEQVQKIIANVDKQELQKKS